MRTNKLLLLGISIMAVGCGTQKPTAFVDLDAVMRAEGSPLSVQEPSQPSPDSWSIGQTVGEDAMPKEQLSARTNSDAIQTARDAIQANLEDARKAAQDHLFKQYLKQVNQYRVEETAKLSEEAKQEQEKIDEKVGEMLIELAKKRHPLVDSVNVYTGYPLPELEKLSLSENAAPAVKKIFTQIRTKLEKIVKLDEEFENQKQALYSEARQQTAKKRLELEVDIQKQIDALMIQAEAETKKIFEKDQSIYEGILVSRPGQTSQALPAKSENIGLQASAPTLPKWGATPPKTLVERRSELEKDLTIFLAVKHYDRTKDKAEGVDLTKDFIAWRSEHRLGR